MKKIGLLCLALVLALGTVGVGFAYWTETLTIGSNPVNTGELKVEFMDNPSRAGPNDYSLPLGQGGYTCTISKTGPQTISVTLGNLFPGAAIWGGAGFDFKIKNTGTIPAKISNVTIGKTGGDDELWNNLNTSCHVYHYYANGTWSGWQAVMSRFGVGSGPPPSLMGPWMAEKLAGKVLLPGEYFSFNGEGLVEGDEDSFAFYVVPTAPNSVEGKSVSFNIIFTATQFNASP